MTDSQNAGSTGSLQEEVSTKIGEQVQMDAFTDAQAVVCEHTRDQASADDDTEDPQRRLIATTHFLRSIAGRLSFARHGAWLDARARQQLMGVLNSQFDVGTFCTLVEGEWESPNDACMAMADAFGVWNEGQGGGVTETIGRAGALTVVSSQSS